MRSVGKVTALAFSAALLVFNSAGAQQGIVPPPQIVQQPPITPGPQGAPAGDAQGAPVVPAPGPLAGPPPLPQALTPPPLPVAPAVVFFVEQNGQPAGPLSLQEVQLRVQQGTVKGETLVWKQGTPAWVAAKDVPELQPLLAAIPPPVPQGEQYKRLVVGTWQTQATNNFGVATNSTITYTPDGNYSGVVVQVYQGLTIPTPASGTWTVGAVSEGKFSLTMTPAGVGAGMPVTLLLRIIDNNNLYNDAERYQARRIR